jgi:hypothetical protein
LIDLEKRQTRTNSVAKNKTKHLKKRKVELSKNIAHTIPELKLEGVLEED